MTEKAAPACDAGITDNLGPDVYAKWRASELGAITEGLEDRLLFDFIGRVDGRDVLDIGCGDGTLAMTLAARGGRVSGIDASPAMIAAATQRAQASGAAISFQQGRVQKLPYGDAQFDIVVAKTIFCFVDDPSEGFAEIARVLRPGGRLVIGELGRWSFWALHRYLRGIFGSPLWRRGHSWTAAQLRGFAQGAGLQVTGIRGAVYFPRSRVMARLMARFDGRLGGMTVFGAAFIAIAATKS